MHETIPPANPVPSRSPAKLDTCKRDDKSKFNTWRSNEAFFSCDCHEKGQLWYVKVVDQHNHRALRESPSKPSEIKQRKTHHREPYSTLESPFQLCAHQFFSTHVFFFTFHRFLLHSFFSSGHWNPFPHMVHLKTSGRRSPSTRQLPCSSSQVTFKSSTFVSSPRVYNMEETLGP